MNKKQKKFLNIIVIILLIGTGITTFILGYNQTSEESKEVSNQPNPKIEPKQTTYAIEEINYELFENGYAIIGIAKNDKEYQKLIANSEIIFTTENNLTKKDYDNYKYLLVATSYDECSEELTYKNIEFKENNTTINIDVNLSCGLCAPLEILYEIAIPKDNKVSENIEVNFNYLNHPECDYNIAYKPVLYLYPEEKSEITISFANDTVLTTTYPKYKDNWQVTAYPNGDLYDKENKYYYALYWESLNYNKVNFQEGFYVSKDNAISFLEEKLTILGLNSKERNEFIIYWLPILENNEHSLVYFELTDQLQKNNQLIINPTPDTLIRIRMHVKKVSSKINIKEQKLTTQERTGYVAVEWGGVVY